MIRRHEETDVSHSIKRPIFLDDVSVVLNRKNDEKSHSFKACGLDLLCDTWTH